ncbi:MAG TPA: EAL domain-containing protein [Thermoanaerobaculia bacterium]|nr:EAL domain-containing protein [Thermoanaerobaculia bacterium]
MSSRYPLTILALAAALTLFSLGTVMLQPRGDVSLIYPATGLGAAILWGFGRRLWPAFVIAQFLISLRVTHSPWVALLVTAIELIVIAIFLAIVMRFRVSRDLARLRDLAVFVGAALLAAIGAGIISGVAEFFVETQNIPKLISDAISFGLSDFASLLIFVPLVLGWRRWPFATRRAFRQWLALTLFLIASGAGIATIGEPASATLFLLLPIVVFTAIVAGVAGAAASGTILLFILLGIGGLQHHGRINAMIRVVFVGTATVTGYILAVVWGEREKSAKRLYDLAHRDPLTGMDNRHELEVRLQRAVTSGPSSAHALLYLDLDQFKLVNDTCGHMAGDRMLQELASQLRHAVPPNASLARLGGDEFACILFDATNDEALAVANALHDATARYRFRFASMSFTVGVSIGITFFPAEGGDTADAVLGRADVACYVAKENGRHRSHVYLPRDEAMLRWHTAIQEVSQLEQSMQNGALLLYRQSIADITSSTPTNFHEVLLRLATNDSVRTSAEFLPVAQRFGLMDRIDRWVLEQACRHLGSNGNKELKLSVNVSGSTLNDPSFYGDVVALQERYGIDPRQLCLEVTETVMIHRLRQAVDAMTALRARGFDLALDDFGAGVASFAYLQELPVTYVKIDGRIVRDLQSDPASEVIIGSLVKLARLRNIECIAEWVENADVIERLRGLGVRYAQGFFLESPVPL